MDDIEAALEILRNALSRSQGRRLAFLQLLYSDSTSDTVSVPEQPRGAEATPDGSPPPVSRMSKDDENSLSLSDRTAGRRDRQPALRVRILDVLADSDRPMKAATIARKLERSNSGSFRELLREMIHDEEVAEHPGHTYWVPGRTVAGR